MKIKINKTITLISKLIMTTIKIMIATDIMFKTKVRIDINNSLRFSKILRIINNLIDNAKLRLRSKLIT